MFYCFQPVDYLQIQQQPQHLTVVAVLSSLKRRVRHLNTIMEQMHRLVNLIPSFIQADPSGSSIYRAITGQTAPKHESGCPVGRAICLSVCVCQSIHLYLSQLIHSLYHVHISSRSLCHFYPSTPAPPCPAMRSMCGVLPTICAGSTSVYSPQTY